MAYSTIYDMDLASDCLYPSHPRNLPYSYRFRYRLNCASKYPQITGPRAKQGNTMSSEEEITSFEKMALSKPLLKALVDVGYETPSPIQAQTIPLLLEGRDVLGQAQTGTGKTAAFALPILSKLAIKQKEPQVMVLAPTPRTRHTSRRSLSEVRQSYKRFSRSTHLWRSGLQRPDTRFETWCTCGGRYTRPSHGPYASRHIETQSTYYPRPGRSR